MGMNRLEELLSMPFEELTQNDLDEITLLSLERAWAAEDEKTAENKGAENSDF